MPGELVWLLPPPGPTAGSGDIAHGSFLEAQTDSPGPDVQAGAEDRLLASKRFPGRGAGPGLPPVHLCDDKPPGLRGREVCMQLVTDVWHHLGLGPVLAVVGRS